MLISVLVVTSRQHSNLKQVRVYVKVAGRNFNQWKICFGTHVIKYINGWMLIMVILVQKRTKNLTGTMIQTHDLKTCVSLLTGSQIWPISVSPTFGHFLVARTMGDLAAASIATVLVAVKHTQSQHILKEKTQRLTFQPYSTGAVLRAWHFLWNLWRVVEWG